MWISDICLGGGFVVADQFLSNCRIYYVISLIMVFISEPRMESLCTHVKVQSKFHITPYLAVGHCSASQALYCGGHPNTSGLGWGAIIEKFCPPGGLPFCTHPSTATASLWCHISLAQLTPESS